MDLMLPSRILGVTASGGKPFPCTHRRRPSAGKFVPLSPRRTVFSFSSSNDTSSPSSSITSTQPQSQRTPEGNPSTVFVGDEDVPLEGVIQFEKPDSQFSRVYKWGRIALLAGGDVLAIFAFSAIGRFSHGFSVFDYETLKTADPFIAGWFLGAYFLGAYGDDGLGFNGFSNALSASVKSWAIGIPIGLAIRGATSGHVPAYTFVLVSMGSTFVLLCGWRALASKFLASQLSKKTDVYKRGNPFELFELLTSLVRRW